VVTAGLDYIGPSRTLSGIAGAAEEAGYSLLLKELAGFEDQDVAPILQALLSHQVDGIIWAAPEVGQSHAWVAVSLLQRDLPLVFLTMQPRPDASVVYIDNSLGGRLAVAHLIEQGYRRIAHISGPLNWWEARQRKTAWEVALIDAGLPVFQDAFVEGDWSPASGVQAFERLLEVFPQMDAVFAANDQMALGVLQVACRRNLPIPQKFGLAGFDDIHEAAFFSPPLTTIHQDHAALAKAAVQEVIRLIDASQGGLEPEPPCSLVLPPRLVVRQSSLKDKFV
jgi:LacI family transcriptional regulator